MTSAPVPLPLDRISDLYPIYARLRRQAPSPIPMGSDRHLYPLDDPAFRS